MLEQVVLSLCREQIVADAIGNISGSCDGCMAGLANMYQDYMLPDGTFSQAFYEMLEDYERRLDVAAPVSAIQNTCKVTETVIPYKYQDENLSTKALMKIINAVKLSGFDVCYRKGKSSYKPVDEIIPEDVIKKVETDAAILVISIRQVPPLLFFYMQ